MKRMILIVLAVICLATGAGAVDIPEELTDALTEDTESLLKEVDFSGADGFLHGCSKILKEMSLQVEKVIQQRIKGVTSILLVVIFCGMVEGFSEQIGTQKLSFLPMVGALSIALVTAGSLDNLIGLGAETIRELALFSKVLLPTLAAATATSGAMVTATIQQVTTVFLVDVLLNLINAFLIPLVYLYIGVLTASACMQDSRLGILAETLKKGLTWILTIVLIGFTGYLSVVHIVSGATDMTKVKMTKTAISGAVPVVGKVIADAAETVLAGAGMLKNSIGIFGMLAILAFCVHPFLQLGIQYLLYKFTAFLAGLVGSQGICKLIDGLGSAFGLVLGMTGACALLLLVSVLASVAAVIP